MRKRRYLQVVVEGLGALLATDATLLVAAKGRAVIVAMVRVDPDLRHKQSTR